MTAAANSPTTTAPVTLGRRPEPDGDGGPLQWPVADWVRERPERRRVFERLGIDYCCHGERTLERAATTLGLDPQRVLDQLAAFDDGLDAASAGGTATSGQAQPEDLDAPALVDHIVSTHHAFLDAALPELRGLAAKVEGVHAGRHPELHDVRRLTDALAGELEPHLRQEEQVVFPALLDGLTRGDAGAAIPSIEELEAEHRAAGLLLADLRNVTDGYATPADACGSFHRLYDLLEATESDTFRHIHLENNVLFPMGRQTAAHAE